MNNSKALQRPVKKPVLRWEYKKQVPPIKLKIKAK